MTKFDGYSLTLGISLTRTNLLLALSWPAGFVLYSATNEPTLIGHQVGRKSDLPRQRQAVLSSADPMKLILSVLVVGALAASAATNLLDQPGFEGTYPNGVAPGWKKFAIRGTARGSFLESSNAHAGAKAQLLQLDEQLDGWFQCSAPIRGGLAAGHDYEARVWLKGDRFLHQLALVTHDKTDWFPTDYAAYWRPISNDWTELVMRFRASTTDTNAQFGIRLNQEGKLGIDDAALYELTATDQPAGSPGNALRNGSFEAGLDGWLAMWMTPVIVTNQSAPHGSRCVQLPGGGPGRQFFSAVTPFASAQTYTLSLYMKSSTVTSAKVSLSARAGTVLQQTFNTSNSWQRYTLTGELPPVPDGGLFVAIEPGGAVFYVDAVHLEPGASATPFKPRAPVEAGLSLDRTNALFNVGESVTARLRLYNSSNTVQSLALNCRVLDVWERAVTNWVLATNAAVGFTEIPITITPSNLTGTFRAECSVSSNTAPPFAETVFSVFGNWSAAAASNSPIGTHIDYGSLNIATNVGARWTKSWLLSWENSQATNGTWSYGWDSLVNSWLAGGMKVLAVLSEAPAREQDRPANPATWGWYHPTNFAHMTEYARRLVEHYSNRIDTFELQNEPNHALHPPAGETTAQGYAREARALADGVRLGNPKARVVLGSVTVENDPDQWLAQVFAADPTLQGLCDAVSYHNYTGDPVSTERFVGRIRNVLQQLGISKSIWDTEWNPEGTVQTFYRDLVRPLPSVSARRGAALVVQGFVSRLGAGVERSFLYELYGFGGMGGSFDIYTEADDRLRPASLAHRVMVAMLNAAPPLQRLDVTNCWCYRFRRADGKPLLVLWAADTQPTPVNVTASGTWQVTDMMGNSLGTWSVGQTLTVGPEPLYALDLTPAILPVAPANLTVLAGPTSVMLNWPAVSNAYAYNVWRATNSGGPYAAAGTFVGTSNYFDGSLAPDRSYFYVVSAVNAAGESAPSGEASAAPFAAGLGLRGDYFSNVGLSNAPVVTETNGIVSFDWGTGSADAALPSDGFSIRWTGQVRPLFSETYTFFTKTDDGARLWVNGVLLIDKWLGQSATEWSNSIALTAGRRYDLKLEYFDNTGDASASLSWSSASTPKQLVSQSLLFPASVITAPTGLTATTVALTQVNLTWADTADNESGFKIERRVGGGSYAQIAVVGPGATNFADTTAAPAATNTYRVRTFNALMDTPYSNEAVAVTPGLLLAATFLPQGSVWRYFDKTNNLGTAWRSNTFSDATWSNGPARLGFGGDGEATKVASNRQWTTYFRRSFYAPNSASLSNLTGRLTRDDAAVIYLNGAEIWRDTNITSGVITNQTPALSTLNAPIETNWVPLNLPLSTLNFLVTGWNQLAVEVHQSSLTSSDLGFDLEVTGTAFLLDHPSLKLAASGSNPALSGPDNASLFTLFTTPNLAPPAWTRATNEAVLSNGVWLVPLPTATNGSRFYRLQWP